MSNFIILFIITHTEVFEFIFNFLGGWNTIKSILIGVISGLIVNSLSKH